MSVSLKEWTRTGNLVTVSISNVCDFTDGHDYHHKQVFNKVFRADCKKKNPVATLATLILLSYMTSKFLL